jgi:hypothetical protein
MENWERRFDRVQPPDSSVPSHRDGLRQKLQSEKFPMGHRRRTVATLSITALLLVSGLTMVYPSWAKDLMKAAFVQTITLHTKDGHTVMIKKMTSDQCSTICDTSACDSSWSTPDGRQYFRKRVHAGGDANGPMRINMICADTSRLTTLLRVGMEVPNPTGETFTISSPDGDKIWVVNGDTIDAKNMTSSSGDSPDLNINSAGSPNEKMDAQKDNAPDMAKHLDLLHNYPNPFNPTTQISFELPKSGRATLKVYNMAGQEIASLVDGYTDAGKHTVTFDGSHLASGTYLYHLRTADFQVSKAMVLAK